MNNFGIRGENVNNFTLRDSEFRGTFGTNASLDEGAIRFGTAERPRTGLTGTALFQGNTIGGGFEDNLAVYVYGANTLNMTVQGQRQRPGGVRPTTVDQLATTPSTSRCGGTSNLTLTVNGVDFNGATRRPAAGARRSARPPRPSHHQQQLPQRPQRNTFSGGGGIAITGGGTNTPTSTINTIGNKLQGQRTATHLRAIYRRHLRHHQRPHHQQHDRHQQRRPRHVAGQSAARSTAAPSSSSASTPSAGSTGNRQLRAADRGQHDPRHQTALGGIMLRSNQQDDRRPGPARGDDPNNTMAEEWAANVARRHLHDRRRAAPR